MEKKSEIYFKYIKERLYLITLSILIFCIFIYALTVSNTNTYIQIINVINAGLIPACFVGLLWEFFTKYDFLKYVQNELCEKLNDNHSLLLKEIKTNLNVS